MTSLTRSLLSASRSASVTSSIASRPRFFSATVATMTKISEAIKDDHREIENAYKNIIGAQTTDDKIRWRNQFTWELARHSIGEELVVYPQFEKLLPDGKTMADKDRQEHLKVKKYLHTLQDMHPEDAQFEPTLQGLWSELSRHIEEEEKQDLPALEKHLDVADSEALTSSFGRTKMFIPTRSHPSAPDKPPFETLAGLLAAPIDHLRDIFRKFPKESKSQLPP